MARNSRGWVRRAISPVRRRAARPIERVVRRAVRHEISALTEQLDQQRSVAETQSDQNAATNAAIAADARREALERQVAELEHELAELTAKNADRQHDEVVRSGLNQLGFREEIAYRGFADDAIFVNIGAGGFAHPRWVNLDVSSDHYEDHRSADFVEYDLNARDRLPFDDDTVALAYTSHAIEHVKDPAVAHVFSEVHRVLEPGGVFRLTCPDARLYYDAAKLGRLDRYFYRMNTWFRRNGVDDADVTPVDFLSKGVATGLCPTPLLADSRPELGEELNRLFETIERDEFLEQLCSHVDFSIAHVARHVNWWTHEKLERMLAEASFQQIRISTFGGSIAAPMCDTTKFDNTVRDESLYIEALK